MARDSESPLAGEMSAPHLLRRHVLRLRRLSGAASRGEVDAADHEGDEDGRRVEAAPRAGAHPARAAVRERDAPRARAASRRAWIRRSTRCSTSGTTPQRRRQALLIVDHRRPRTLRQLQHQRRSRRAGTLHRREPRRGRSRSDSSAAAAATTSRAAGSRCCYEQVNLFASLKFDDAKGIAEARDRGVHVEARVDSVYLVYNEFKSVMSQRRRRQSGCLPIARLDIEQAQSRPSAAGRRSSYLFEPTPKRDVHALLPPARRGAGVPRAARVERRRSTPRR